MKILIIFLKFVIGAFDFLNQADNGSMCHRREEWPRAGRDAEFTMCPKLSELVTDECYVFDFTKMARYANKRYLCKFLLTKNGIFWRMKIIDLLAWGKISSRQS